MGGGQCLPGSCLPALPLTLCFLKQHPASLLFALWLLRASLSRVWRVLLAAADSKRELCIASLRAVGASHSPAGQCPGPCVASHAPSRPSVAPCQYFPASVLCHMSTKLAETSSAAIAKQPETLSQNRSAICTPSSNLYHMHV